VIELGEPLPVPTLRNQHPKPTGTPTGGCWRVCVQQETQTFITLLQIVPTSQIIKPENRKS
jgi:hypothetical protein